MESSSKMLAHKMSSERIISKIRGRMFEEGETTVYNK